MSWLTDKEQLDLLGIYDTTKTRIRLVLRELGIDQVPSDVKELRRLIDDRRKSERGNPSIGRREADSLTEISNKLTRVIERNAAIDKSKSKIDGWRFLRNIASTIAGEVDKLSK